MTQASADTNSVLTPALLKLIEVIDEENGLLRHQTFLSHAGFTDRKNQALRELMAAERRGSYLGAADEVKPLLRQLSATLQENARLLKLHIAAVGEVSDIIVGSLRAADSDGTYSRHPRA